MSVCATVHQMTTRSHTQSAKSQLNIRSPSDTCPTTAKHVPMSNRLYRLLERLKNTASTSDLNMKHSAFIMSGGKVLSVGVNSTNNKITKFGVPCSHAEMSAMIRYYSKECRLLQG